MKISDHKPVSAVFNCDVRKGAGGRGGERVLYVMCEVEWGVGRGILGL